MLSITEKARLAARVWVRFGLVTVALRRKALPALVGELAETDGSSAERSYSPATLSNAVHRSLRLGSRRPRCLVQALVLFRLLREQGEPAELLIGLPPQAANQEAHAWVELRGRDVGPPPGRHGHEVMARLP